MTKFILRNRDSGSLEVDVPLDTRLDALIERARDFLKDEKITPENFGSGKRFYFVNRSTRTLIDDNVPTYLRLDSLAILPGHEIELFLA